MDDDEIEFQDDLDRLKLLAAEVMLAHAVRGSSAEHVIAEWYDIKTYGNEPVFTSIIFERLMKEDEAHGVDQQESPVQDPASDH
jgi:hypothetical protein